MLCLKLDPLRSLNLSRVANGLVLVGAALALVGCGGLRVLPVRAALYDFGPGLEPASSAVPSVAAAPVQAAASALPLLALAPVESSAAVDSLAVLYRLSYDNPQQLRPYAAARWSMPAGQLFEQRLRQKLEQQRRVVRAGEGPALSRAAGGRLPWVLRLELEEFSQVFSSPSQSQAVLRLRASVLDPSPGSVRLVAQRMLVQQVSAITPDAAGGVAALGQATDAAALALGAWLAVLESAERAEVRIP